MVGYRLIPLATRFASAAFPGVVCLAGLLLATPALAQRRDLARDNIASLYRGQEGKRITVVCAPKASPGTVWGTDAYTDDSSICGAAVHAGVINAGEGGAVTAVITAARGSYEGSERNGITSRSFGKYYGSFTVEKGDGGEIDWTTRATGLESVTGSLAVVCPAAEKTLAGEMVWGSDIYTDDTPMCVAAVHAGVITAARGGRVAIEAAPGRSSYRGTSRNGVQSKDYGSWPRSFRFEGVTQTPVDVSLGLRNVRPEVPQSPTQTQPLLTRTPGSVKIPNSPGRAAPSLGNERTVAPTGNTMVKTPIGSRALIQGTDPVAVHATNLKASAGIGKITLTWTAAPGAVGYRLARGSWDAAKQAWVQSAAADIPDKPADDPGGLIGGNTFDDASVTPGTQYTYWLDTYFRGASGALYSPLGQPYPTVIITSREAAASPANLKAVSGSGFVYLTWNATPDALGYLVRRTDGGSTVTLSDRIPKTDSLAPNPYFIDTNAETRTYAYRVAAVYAAADGTRYSSDLAQAPAVSAAPRTEPDQVTGLKVTGFALTPEANASCLLCTDGRYRGVYLQWASQFDASWSVVAPFNELGIVALEVWDPAAGWTAGTRQAVLSRQDRNGEMETLVPGLEKAYWNRPSDPPICYVVTDESVRLQTRVVRVRVTFYQYNAAHEHAGKPTRSVYSRPASFTARIYSQDGPDQCK